MYKIFRDSGFDLGFVIMIGSFTLLWILSIIITNVAIVDIAWGIGYTANVLIFFFCHEWNWANLVVMIVVGLHGLRLGLYILVRNCGHGEDKRYQAFRAKFGGDRKMYSNFLKMVKEPILITGGFLFSKFLCYNLFLTLDYVHHLDYLC